MARRAPTEEVRFSPWPLEARTRKHQDIKVVADVETSVNRLMSRDGSGPPSSGAVGRVLKLIVVLELELAMVAIAMTVAMAKVVPVVVVMVVAVAVEIFDGNISDVLHCHGGRNSDDLGGSGIGGDAGGRDGGGDDESDVDLAADGDGSGSDHGGDGDGSGGGDGAGAGAVTGARRHVSYMWGYAR